MRIGIGIGVRVNGEYVDPAGLLERLTDLLEREEIVGVRFDQLVRFSADDAESLRALAEPVAEWWQSFGPSTRGDVALTMVGPGGTSDLTYCLPEQAVVNVRHSIATECGPHYEAGEAPGVVRRSAARVVRRLRAGFTASEVRIETEGGCLMVSVAGRDLDDRPHAIEFQAVDPTDPDYDHEDDEGYCLVNEDHAPVYNALESLRLAGNRLRLTLTRDAADAWGMSSRALTIRLRLTSEDAGRLRSGLRRVFEMSTADPPGELRL